MTRLSLQLFGGFQAQLDGKPLAGLKTDKTRALLAYLAVASRQPHQRTHLAGLFWPDWPEDTARTYLRQALSNLRQVLGDDSAPVPFLLATRQLIELNPEGDLWVDVVELVRTLSMAPKLDGQCADPDTVARLQTAVALYRGRLLEGFFLDGCSAFEEWQLLTGEHLQRQVVDTLHVLFRWHEAQGDLAQAEQYARRCVEIEPLLDEPHRQFMRLLALRGEQGAALAHYEQYRHLLANELDAPPPAATVALAEQIRRGQVAATSASSGAAANSLRVLPPYLAITPAPGFNPPFVAREQELAQLETTLSAAIAGQGSIVFVVGDAGRGKTALLRAFARRAMQVHPALLVAGGSCSSREGRGDPLLPFREILAQLTGDLEAPWAAGAIDGEHARRLWGILPATVEALLHHGPALVGTLTPAPGLCARVAYLPGGAAWCERIDKLAPPASAVTSSSAEHMRQGTQPGALFDQFTTLLQVLAGQCPLLLWLDDLHWADLDSIALLFHLGQRLAGSRILLIGAYRPEEVALSSHARLRAQHPLDEVVHELQQRSGHSHVDLNRVEGRMFVDAYLDSEPYQLSPEFRERLYRLSGGHPLFTVELLRTMQARGDLTRNGAGDWVEGPALDWDTMPVRVSAVISQRIKRLPDELRRLLTVASVQGEQFSAEIVAAVLDCQAQAITQSLSDELERRHQLVIAAGVRRCGSLRLAQYRFRHVLFQKYMIDSLDAVERVQLHEAVARALETIYQEQPDELPVVAGQLAWQYQQAEFPEKAIPYHILAGQWAIRLSANQEALEHFRQGLALLDRLADPKRRAPLQLELLCGLSVVQAMLLGAGTAEVEQTLAQAYRIGQQLEATPALFQLFLSRWEHHYQRGEFRFAQQLAAECLRIAEQLQEPLQLSEANNALGSTLYHLGQMASAQQHLATARKLSDARPRAGQRYAHRIDPLVGDRVNEAIPLWYLGYPDQARQRIAEALTLAETNANVYTLVFALAFAAGIHQRMGDWATMLVYAERVARLSIEHQFALWAAVGDFLFGYALAARGECANGLSHLQRCMAQIRAAGLQFMRYDATLADAYLRCGQTDEALALLDQLLATITMSDEREWEAELYRLKGESLLMRDPSAVREAETCFHRAIDVARQQQAKSFELRTTLSLCRLWERMGRCSEARASLTEVYNWFSEGFDTPDLQEARALLAAWR